VCEGGPVQPLLNHGQDHGRRAHAWRGVAESVSIF
jgi:hypothetical protein